MNLALNLPAARSPLNGLQPDQFAVNWQRAWSLYPLRVVLSGIVADGEPPTEQRQLHARRATVSVSRLPQRGEIRIHELDLEDIDRRLRPRRQPDAEPAEVADYFPVMRKRDPNALVKPPHRTTSTPARWSWNSTTSM